MNSTIVALATPPGAGGIAVVRLSGPESYQIGGKVFRPRNPEKQVEKAKGYTALYGRFVDGETTLDEGVALFFRAPHSYTGEDVIELSCHGGMVIAQSLIQACIGAGVHQAGFFEWAHQPDPGRGRDGCNCRGRATGRSPGRKCFERQPGGSH